MRKQKAKEIEFIKKHSVRHTKKHKLVSLLQANVKGFLFRSRKEKGLTKAQNIEEELGFEDPGIIDVNTFFNINEDNFNADLKLPEGMNIEDIFASALGNHSQPFQPVIP